MNLQCKRTVLDKLFLSLIACVMLFVSACDGLTSSHFEVQTESVVADDVTSDNPDNASGEKILPSVPESFIARDESYTEVTLVWLPSSQTVSYKIFRSTTPSALVFITNLSGESTKYTDKNLNPQTTYYYTMQACNSAGCSNYATVNIATLPNPPIAPDNVVVSFVDGEEVTLSWDKVAGVSSYKIYRAEAQNNKPENPIAQQFNQLQTSYTDNSFLQADTTYFYWIEACNAGGCSSSKAMSVTTMLSISATPSDFMVTVVSGDTLSLTWSEVENENISYYQIYRGITDDISDASMVGDLLASEEEKYIDRGLAGFTTYYYWLRSCTEDDRCSPYTSIEGTTFQPLNDTGITRGASYPSGNNGMCTSQSTKNNQLEIQAEQDCDQGRDANSATNGSSDGQAGFSFTKLDEQGREVNANVSRWYCVYDEVTGLIWEVKTDDGGLHDKDDTFSWYNTDESVNGGDSGRKSQYDACYGYDRNDDISYCTTQFYVDRVNAKSLCGYNDWRLPNVDELWSLVYYGDASGDIAIAIDSDYFPHTALSYYRSSSAAIDEDEAWSVGFNRFSGSHLNASNRGAFQSVRLVRGNQPLASSTVVAATEGQVINTRVANFWADSRYLQDADNGTVIDKFTGLMWKKCTEGRSGSECQDGLHDRYDWRDALEYAENHTYAGFSDWRLPNIRELASLAAKDRHTPMINTAVFPNTLQDPNFDVVYWSSSLRNVYDNQSWAYSFKKNGSNDEGWDRKMRPSVRLVRDAN